MKVMGNAGATELVAKLRAMVDDKQDALKCYKEEYVEGGNSSVKILELLNIGTTESNGSSVPEIDNLGSVGTVSELDYLGTLAWLNSLGTIGTLDYLGTLAELSYLGTLGTVNYLGTIGTLDHLTTLARLNSLGTVTALNYLGTLAEVSTLGVIGTRSPAMARLYSLLLVSSGLSSGGYVADSAEYNSTERQYIRDGLSRGDLVYGEYEGVIGLYKVSDTSSSDPYVTFTQVKADITV